jgi:hypothetical protein
MFLAAAWNTARWIVQHDQDAQDLVQEAHVRISARAGALDRTFPTNSEKREALFLPIDGGLFSAPRTTLGWRQRFSAGISPRLNPITIYFMIDPGHSRRPETLLLKY